MNMSLDSDGCKRMPAQVAGSLKAIYQKVDAIHFCQAKRFDVLTLQQKKYLIAGLTLLNLGLLGATVSRDHKSVVRDVWAIESMVSVNTDTNRTATIKPVKKPAAIESTITSVEVTPTPTPTAIPTPAPTAAVAGVNISRTVEGSKQDWMRAAGIAESDWSCADGLVARESGWRINATNASSGAYGLPQALPGSKMATMGADWQYNPVTQLRWMASYVTKYGGWCGALSFQTSNGWY